MEWTDFENDVMEYDGAYICTSQQGFYLTPAIARELSDELLKWADSQNVAVYLGRQFYIEHGEPTNPQYEALEWHEVKPIAVATPFTILKYGKRYLTRDWKVVKYDGTQDVVARVHKCKEDDVRFEDENNTMVVDWEDDGNKFFTGLFTGYPKGQRAFVVRVSDLPDDMKGGPK